MQDQISSDGYYGAPELSVRNVEGGGVMPPIDPTYTQVPALKIMK